MYLPSTEPLPTLAPTAPMVDPLDIPTSRGPGEAYIYGKVCVKCNPGHYSTNGQTKVCKKCTQGRVTRYYGPTSCQNCPLAGLRS
jgi:hypothetical protein